MKKLNRKEIDLVATSLGQMHWLSHNQTEVTDGIHSWWVPVKPLDSFFVSTWKTRFKSCWLILRGKATAVPWF